MTLTAAALITNITLRRSGIRTVEEKFTVSDHIVEKFTVTRDP